jgi:hypothetical protein
VQVGIGQVNHAILPPLQEQKGDKGHHGGSGLNDADEKIVPCFSEDEFRAMSDGFRDVEPYDEITTMWEANGDVEGEWFRAYGGEEGENGDGAWTWIEKSIGEGNWCFYEWVQEGYPMVKETVLELTDEEFMACYRIIEAECSAQ